MITMTNRVPAHRATTTRTDVHAGRATTTRISHAGRVTTLTTTARGDPSMATKKTNLIGHDGAAAAVPTPALLSA
jgi:hypothetical protein